MTKLYRHPLSGHAHRTELFLSLIGKEVELVDVDLLAGEQKSEAFRALNPLEQVSVLDDEGTIISDSNAILVYLATKYAPESWYPREPERAAAVQKWLSVAAGEEHFNTLDNIVLNPRVGLLFPDFYSGDLLYLTGRAEIIWDGPDVDAFDGAERLVRFEVESVIRVNGSLPFRGGFEAFSPVLRRTGNWQEVIAARRSLNSAL